MVNYRENINFNDPHYFGHILGGTEVTFSCTMHHSGDTATLVLNPNLGWLSKIPLEKAQISLKLKSYYEVLMPAKFFILLIFFTYEVKKNTLLSKIYEKTLKSADFLKYYLQKINQTVNRLIESNLTNSLQAILKKSADFNVFHRFYLRK